MKHCKQCGAQKAESEFYLGRRSCKECVKATVRANYQENREHFREYERRRAKLPHREAARSKYLESDRGRERSNAAKKAYMERNADIRAAHVALDNAVRDGRVWKSPCCMAPGCFSTDRLHGHHSDYSQPLSVVWLCHSCHVELHRAHNARRKAS